MLEVIFVNRDIRPNYHFTSSAFKTLDSIFSHLPMMIAVLHLKFSTLPLTGRASIISFGHLVRYEFVFYNKRVWAAVFRKFIAFI